MKTIDIDMIVDLGDHSGIIMWCIQEFGDWGHVDSELYHWSIHTALRGGGKFDCKFSFKRPDDATLFRLTWQ